MKMIPYIKKAIKALMILLIIWIVLIINIFINGNRYVENFVENYCVAPKLTTQKILYDILSKDYKDVISRNEYNGAHTDEEIFALFQKISMVEPQCNYENKYIISTSQYKKGLRGAMVIDEKTYRVSQNIDFGMNKFGFLEVVKWEITISELE